MQLIVAEKPSVARDLARVLGIRPVGQHCFEGGGRVITWCVGHLVELEEPAAYDPKWRTWRLDALPMLPPELRLRPAKHAAAQLRAVTKLLRERRFDSVVNACDAGREGELIFRYVYQYAGGGPKVLRLWISSLTDEAIRRGFASLRPGAQLDPLGDAARARSEADWLVGMNATRAVTARARDAGAAALYSIGRVQTPTLAMLVAREQAIRAFVPRPYWEVRGEFRTAAGERFAATWRHQDASRVSSAALADEICARDRVCAARVERIRARTVREPPPLLFDLTSLQRTANRRFGWSAARTLELAQALYERHKLLTYPRTDSRHLSSDVVPELPGIIDALGAAPDYAAFAAELRARGLRPSRRIVDDSKVSDHHAIIPTARPPRPDALDRDERRLFDLVARRFLGAFFPDAEFAATEVWVRVGDAAAGASPPDSPGSEREPRGERERGGGGEREPRGERGEGEAEAEAPILERLPPMPDRYRARGRVRLVAGWQAVAGIDGADNSDRRGADAEPAGALPPLVEGQPLDGAYTPLAKQTTPPPRYTEATLLAAMESAGKSIDDEALRQAMKDCGLGTPATRAATIETLLRRDYVTRVKQHLVPTETGIGLIRMIAALPVASLASPELTGQWEARLAQIARGKESRAAFMADIAQYVRELVEAIRGALPPALPPGESPASAPGGPAPRSGSYAPRSGSYARGGAASRRGRADRGGSKRKGRKPRGKREWREARLAASAATTAASGSPAASTRAARSAASAATTAASGSPAASTRAAGSAASTLTTRSAAASTRAAAPVDVAAAAADLGCPRCRAGTLIAGQRGWGCSRWREGCRFVVWFQTAGRRLTAAQLRDLVTRGKTRKARFVAEGGAPAMGRLVLDPSADAGAARFEPA